MRFGGTFRLFSEFTITAIALINTFRPFCRSVASLVEAIWEKLCKAKMVQPAARIFFIVDCSKTIKSASLTQWQNNGIVVCRKYGVEKAKELCGVFFCVK